MPPRGLCLAFGLLAVVTVAVHAGHPGHTEGTCRNADGTAIDGAGTGGHHHRRRRDAHPMPTVVASCGDWIPLISNYTAEDGADGGTFVRVFDDGSTTAQIDAVIKRNGVILQNYTTMAHLHVGPCTADPMPAFDGTGVRVSTVGAHWMNADKKEVHFGFNTTTKGETEAMTCTTYPVDSTAMSVVLHEADPGDTVIGLSAKKLCCNLKWAPASAASATTSASLLAVLVAVAVHFLA